MAHQRLSTPSYSAGSLARAQFKHVFRRMKTLLVLLGPVLALGLPPHDPIPLSRYGSRIYGFPDFRHGAFLETLDVRKINPEEIGPYLEGDILIPGPAPRDGASFDSTPWPGGRIPYVIDSSFSQRSRSLILQAMEAFHSSTCIRFEPRSSADRNYVSIESSSTGCWSTVGMAGTGSQTLNLQEPGCTTLIGTVIHELNHAVGFMHEQNRGDRDSYVSINYGNIMRGMEFNFEKINNWDEMGTAYDYGSVMHYELTAFSSNGRPTMTALRPTSVQIGQRQGLSELDVAKINLMYGCQGGKGVSQGDSGVRGGLDLSYEIFWGSLEDEESGSEEEYEDESYFGGYSDELFT